MSWHLKHQRSQGLRRSPIRSFADFCNTIGTFQTNAHHQVRSAVVAKPDSARICMVGSV
jgi:hypothetical protein